MNICKNCTHLIGIGPVWHSLYCGHPEEERVLTVDPVMGDQCYSATNDLGTTYYTEEKHPHARTVNTDGECGRYEALNRPETTT